MCALCFLMFVLSFCKKDVFLALCRVLKVNRIQSGFVFHSLVSFFFILFFLYDVSSMSIALDNQLRQKEKPSRGPLNSLVSPQSIYIVGCLIWIIKYVNLLHIISYD